jgi:hypothetical protein
VLVQVVGLLVLEQRLSYQALKRLFDLDDAYLNGIKVELIDVRQRAGFVNSLPVSSRY